MPKKRPHHAPGRARRRARGRGGSAPRPAVDPRLAALLDALEEAGAELDGVERALEAEAWASALAGTWLVGRAPGDEEAADRLTRALLERLAASGGPRASAMAAALAAVLPGDPGRAAHEVARGPGRPAWAGATGVRADRAWIAEDVLGDGASVMVAFHEEGGGRHALLAYVDENLAGLLKDIILVDDPEAAIERFRAAAGEGVTVRELPVAEAAARLRGGLGVTDTTFDPPVSEEYHRLRLLLDARLRALPDAEPPAPPPEVPEDERAALVREFLASPEAAGVADLPDAEDIAWRLVDYRCDAADGRPLRWSPPAVEILLVDWLPRKVAQDPEWFAQVPGVLAAMVRFAARRSGLDERFAAETLEAVGRHGASLVEAAGDPERWGPAKGLVMRMRSEGVDLGDEDAVREWVDEYNRALERTGAADAGPLDLFPSDDGVDRWLAEWEEVDADAVRLLREALAAHRGAPPPEPDLALAAERLRRGMAERTWPHPHIRRGAGFGPRPPRRDGEVVVRSAAAYILQRNDLGLDIEEESAIASLQHADWLGAVIELVRAGPGADASPRAIVRAMARCPEVGDEPIEADDRDHLRFAFELLLPAWQAAGAVDEDRRLTRLGLWALPRALAHAWGGDFDA